MATERLQKVLAASGVASRRASEVLIANGRVTVDGKRATLGMQVDAAKAVIAVDGRVIGAASAPEYLMLHKPGGVTSTVRDRHASKTVLDMIPTAMLPEGGRLYPVGRLDQDSEGLLVLTNDGAWADRVLHPRHGIEREYAIGLRAPLSPDQVTAIKAGIPLDEGLATLTGLRATTEIETRRLVELISPPPGNLTWYRAILAQGWKRQLRRMFGAVGAPIERLVRVRMGPVRLDDLASGRARRLRAPEVRGLGAGAGVSRAGVKTARSAACARRDRPPARRSGDERGATAPRGGAAVAAHRGLPGRLDDDRLHGLARARARAPVRRLRRAVALVGRRPRGVLGLGRGLLRDPAAWRRGTASWPRATMPGARWFEGAELNYAEVLLGRLSADRPALLFQSERHPLREVECRRARATRSRRWRPVCAGSGSVAVTASWRSSRTSPRRSSRCWRAPASVRSGRAARRISGRAAWSIASRRSRPKVLIAVDGYTYGGKPFDRRDVDRRAARGAADPASGPS